MSPPNLSDRNEHYRRASFAPSLKSASRGFHRNLRLSKLRPLLTRSGSIPCPANRFPGSIISSRNPATRNQTFSLNDKLISPGPAVWQCQAAKQSMVPLPQIDSTRRRSSASPSRRVHDSRTQSASSGGEYGPLLTLSRFNNSVSSLVV